MFKIKRISVLILAGLLALCLLVVVGSFGLGRGDDGGTTLVSADGDDIDVVDVTDHFPSVPVPVVFGTSKLLRTDEGIAFKLDTTGLVAGTGYTLWVFIDENDDTDLGGALGAFELRIQMGGEFAAADKSGQFSSFLPAGAFPAANGLNVLASDDRSFDDPEGANVLLIVRWHGKAVPGLEYDQTHFVNGGPIIGPDNLPNESVQEAFHIGDDD